jgi:hypothetical protein
MKLILRASILFLPNGDIELTSFILDYLLSMIIYLLTNVEDKFIIIKSFVSLILYYYE